NKRAFVEYVLVNIRHGSRVRINPGLAGKKPDEPGSSSAQDTNSNPRLQNAVAFANNAFIGIKLRPVQRVGNRPNQSTRGIPGKFRVRIEGDDVFDVRQNGNVPHEIRKALPASATQQ